MKPYAWGAYIWSGCAGGWVVIHHLTNLPDALLGVAVCCLGAIVCVVLGQWEKDNDRE